MIQNYIPLDAFEIDIPRKMRSYFRQNGYHFSKKACIDAVNKLKRLNPATGKLEHNKGYDFVYVYNYGKATFFKSSVPDEKTLALYVKDVIDNPLMPGGNEFRRYCVDCDAKGEPVEWDDIL